MNGKLDVAKGRIKEAAGVLINDEDLRKEGKADQAAGKAKAKSSKKLSKRCSRAPRQRSISSRASASKTAEGLKKGPSGNHFPNGPFLILMDQR